LPNLAALFPTFPNLSRLIQTFENPPSQNYPNLAKEKEKPIWPHQNPTEHIKMFSNLSKPFQTFPNHSKPFQTFQTFQNFPENYPILMKPIQTAKKLSNPIQTIPNRAKLS
jgi:hypothetical protein